MRILICDDERNVLASLKSMTEDILKSHIPCGNIDIKTFDSAYDMFEYIEDAGKYVDAVILDIELNDIDGIEAANKIEKEYGYIKIIFCTGFIKYSEKVFQVNPLYCIYKPITRDRLEMAIKKLLYEIERGKKKYITVKSFKCVYHIKTESIIYAEINDRHINLYTEEGMIEAIENMDKLSSRLGSGFVRCHKSYIININKMKKMEQDKLVLEDGTVVAVSRRYKTKVKEAIAEVLM